MCGTVNPPDAKFCGNCGNPLGSAAGGGGSPGHRDSTPGLEAAAAAGPIALAGQASIAERRLVSVLFVDLVGFTTASEQRDAEDTRELLTHYYDAAREAVARHGGTIEKFIGDAVMAVWGTPAAHEDDAERAVRAALELVSAVPRLDGASQLQARAGVLTGEAAVSIGLTGQGMIAGDLVNTASRLQSAARPGTVLVGEATFRAASRAISFEGAGQRELKGKELPVPVWEAVSVVARRGGEGRAAILEPPFVGRDDELQLLKDMLGATGREGKPRLVTITGVAGIGKSRLLWELEKYLDGVVENVFWHAGRSPSYGEGISYWALAEMVRSRSGITDTDDPATIRERVHTTLERFVPDEAERRWIEPRLLGLLGHERLPSESREELFAAWRTFFERIAEQNPVVLGFWDLQWADQGTLDFIEHVLGWARSSPILVLAEARPELFDRRPDWGRSQRSATLMHLDPMDDAQMRRLLEGLVPGIPPEPMRRIVDRAEGVPLYAVETLRMLLDRGVLQPAGRHYSFAGELPELAVPETLHALIAARLDALAPEERSLLTDASVLGLSFSPPSIVAVSGQPDELVTRLAEGLVRRELLTIEVDSRSPERGQYRFVQGVVREIAYQSIAKKNRQAKHLAAARFFESLGEDELAGVLATHYLAAWQAAPTGPQASTLAAQARVALRGAADRATALHDLVGALTYFEQALLVTTDDLEQAALHERALTVAGHAARFGRAHEHAEQAVAIYRAHADRLGEIRTRAREADVHHGEHHDRKVVDALQGLLAAASDLGPSADIAMGEAELARALMLEGSPEAITRCDRVLEHPEVAPSDVLLETLITKGTALITHGREVEAEALLRGVIPIADAQGNLAASLRARNNLRVHLHGSNLRDALALTIEVRDLALKFGQLTWVLHAVTALRDVGFRMGRWDDFEDDVKAFGADAGEFYVEWYELERWHRRIFQGEAKAALQAIDVALTREVITSSAQAITWNLAVKAEALIALGRFAEAFDVASSGFGRSSESDAVLDVALFAAGWARRPGASRGGTSRVAATQQRAAADGPGIRRDGRQLRGAAHRPLERGPIGVSHGREAPGRGWRGRAPGPSPARGRTHRGGPIPGGGSDAPAAADAFFAERAATGYVEAWRARAARAPATGAKPERDGSRSPAKAPTVRAAR